MMTATLADTIFAATITALASGLGGLPFVFIRNFPAYLARFGWAVAGGLMLAASLFNLIMPGVADGGHQSRSHRHFAWRGRDCPDLILA